MVFRKRSGVLELDPSQITVIRPETPPTEKSPQELTQDRKKRTKAFGGFMTGISATSKEEPQEGRRKRHWHRHRMKMTGVLRAPAGVRQRRSPSPGASFSQ